MSLNKSLILLIFLLPAMMQGQEPESSIYVGTDLIPNDTLIIKCPDDVLDLSVQGGDSIAWFCNGLWVETSERKMEIIEDAVWQAEAHFGDTLILTSHSVTFTNNIVELDIKPDTLRFHLNESEFTETQSTWITNSSTITYAFKRPIDFPSPFKLSAEIPIDSVFANSSKEYFVEFAPFYGGQYNELLIFEGKCGQRDTVWLFAFKEITAITADPLELIYDTVLVCNDTSFSQKISIRNNKNNELTIRKPLIDQPFMMKDSDFPLTIDAKSTDTIEVWFLNNNAPGHYKESLRIPLDIPSQANRYDTLRITVEGDIISPEYDIAISALDFGEIAGCRRDTILNLEVSNTGLLPISFETQPALSEVEIMNIPLNIPVGGNGNLQIKVSPATLGNFDKPINIIASPCAIAEQIRLQGSRTSIDFEASSPEVDFGELVLCSGDETLSLPVTVSVIGNPGTTPVIESISGLGPGYSSPDLSAGQSFAQDYTFNIEFTPASSGTFSSDLQLTLQPCDVELLIPLRGRAFEVDYDIRPTDLYIGPVMVNQKGTDYFVIENIGSASFTVDNITGIMPPLSYEASNPVLPFDVQPGESTTITVGFTSDDIEIIQRDLNIIIGQPCPDSENIVPLTASSSDTSTIYVAYRLHPTSIIGAPGQKVTAYVYQQDHPRLEFARVTRLVATMAYDPMMLEFEEIKPGIAYNNIKNIRSDLSAPGELKVELEPDDNYQVSDEYLFEVSFRVLLGDKIRSLVKLDTVEYESLVKVTGDSSQSDFELVGSCLIGQRLLEMNSPTGMAIAGANPADDFVELQFTVAGEDRTLIEIYDVLGRRRTCLVDISLRAGQYSVPVMAGELEPGTYHIVMHSGNYYGVQCLVISR